ncbi:MAG: hypothetical protein DHS20C18_28350 [Saprospiraceae bacterium]|nr:MAG: hypothetical protein DHS20C18_28350 [Saprospiraceae bacterium]
MTTKEIANRLVELCRKGQHEEAYKELFADNAVALEPEGFPNHEVKGKAALLKKNEDFGKMVIEMHDSSVSDPIVAGNHFSVSMMIDSTMKEQGRSKMEEICLYEVKDGKIVKEQFFYNM